MANRTFTTSKAAQGWERDKFVEKDHGGWVALSGGRMTLQEYATDWLEGAVDLAPSSRRIYESNLRLHIFPMLGGYKLDHARGVRPLVGEPSSQARTTRTRVWRTARLSQAVSRFR
jgi:hypothetical protein